MSNDPLSPPPPPQGYPPQPGYPQGYGVPPLAPTSAGPTSSSFTKRLGLAGQIAGIGGLLIAISFLVLPWSVLGDHAQFHVDSGTPEYQILGTGHTGFSTAIWVSTHQAADFFKGTLFPQLWLVFLAAMALVVVALLIGLEAVSARWGILSIIELSGLALVMELLYLVQLTSLNSAVTSFIAPVQIMGTFYAPGFGFWLALVVSLAILATAIYGWRQTRRATPYAGPPLAPASAGPSANSFFKQAGLIGLVTGIGGALIVIFFFALPWSVFGETNPSPELARVGFGGYNGLDTVVGVRGGFFSYPGGALFAHLWLVLLGALGFVALAVLMGQGRVSARLGALSIIGIAAVALVTEGLYVIQIVSMNSAEKQTLSSRLNYFIVGPGLWVALGVTLVILGVAVYGRLRKRGVIT